MINMMIGLPGSGKSTFAAQQNNMVTISSDAIRKELYGEAEIQGSATEVFNTVIHRAKSALPSSDILIDATNLSEKKRNNLFYSIDPKHEYDHRFIIMATPVDECKKRNANRSRKVSNQLIDRMARSFCFPSFNEREKVKIVYSTDKRLNIYDKIWELRNFKQESKYHTLSLGEHLLLTQERLPRYSSKNLMAAALLHDIGKEYTKTFTNYLGTKETEFAHYYDHEKRSAYEAMFYEGTNNKILCLVANHMNANILSENNLKRFLDSLSEEDRTECEWLHMADVKAH